MCNILNEYWDYLFPSSFGSTSRKCPFIQDRFNIEIVMLETMVTLFLSLNMELDHRASLQKQIARIQKEENLPVVIELLTVSSYRRDAFIDAKIPFVVPEKQLYLPHMGTYLQERFNREAAKLEKFQPAAQILFFYYLYQGQGYVYL